MNPTITKIRSMLDCAPHEARDLYIEMMDAGIFNENWYKISWADQEIIVKDFASNAQLDTTIGDKAIITHLRQAFEDCEQIAADNPTDKNVARLLTALHDQFDLWMRDDQGHKDLIGVLMNWLTTCEHIVVQDES